MKSKKSTRLAESKKLFGKDVLAVEIHNHSVHSDGEGTVEDNYRAAMDAGLDFYFCTDHDSLRQKEDVAAWSNASWGQEPATLYHHYGMLMGTRLFEPVHDDIAADFRRAKEIAPFVWIPHPVGWHPDVWYNDFTIDALWTLGDSFAMEVMNGIMQTDRAFDEFDAKAVRTWDRLLSDGRRVTALGSSDAHEPATIGTVFTGVFASECSATAIVEALNLGRCFATEASLLDLSCNEKQMGSVLQAKPGEELNLHYCVCDAAGIDSVRIVSGGSAIMEMKVGGSKRLDDIFQINMPNAPAYFRLESTATDDRRAFSSPIYFVL